LNVLVTGATGFLGSTLVERLVKDGHEVTVLSRRPCSLANLKRQKLNLCYASFGDLDTLRGITNGKEVIFHLAALINAPRESVHLYQQANVLTTKNLLRVIDRSVLKSFVYCSSVAVYGKLKNLPADETTGPHPDNLYGQSKYEAEKICMDFFNKEKIPVVIVRPTWIYGPRDRRTFKLFKLINNRFFKIIGNGEVLIHPVFVDDLVDALNLCAVEEKANGQTFIIGGKEVVELNNLVSLIAKALNKPSPRMHIPLWLAEIAAFILEKSYGYLGRQAPLSRRRLEFFTRSQQYDISKAERELSFKPRYDLIKGLNLTVNWYHKEGWL